MTTSLAGVATNNSNYFMSSSNSSPVLPTTSNQSAVNNSPTSIMDVTDSNYEIKTEFYTREGIWKLVPNCEYMRSQQQTQNYYQQQNQLNNSNSSSNSANLNQLNNGNNGNNGNNNINQFSNSPLANDQVKLGIFNFSYETIYGKNLDNNQTSFSDTNKISKLCKECNTKLRLDNDEEEVDNDDDDNDVIFTKFNHNSINNNNNIDINNLKISNNKNATCKLCNKKLDKKEQNTSTNSGDQNNSSNCFPSLDLILFNYAREIYTYEFNSIKSKSNEPRNLVDKKLYKTLMSSCFDINYLASQANTLVYQSKAPQLVANSSTITPNTGNSPSFKQNLNLSPSYLSLIVAAGFNKGEIHVFDVFKKEAFVFFNNSKLIDKTKVTCIKWLPNSINLFLASYSSGNIYLYDASNLIQTQVAPVYTKLIQNESFSIYVNNNASLSSSSNQSNNSNNTNLIQLSELESQTNNNNSFTKKNSNNNSSNSLNKNSSSPIILTNGLGQSNLNQQLKLVLANNLSSSSNQQSNNSTNNQIAKNPLLKFSIGNTSAYFSNDATSNSYTAANSNMSSFGINGVNEFAFSPCGQYLAIVSQDGFLRVFKFIYKSNQEMQIELHCSMKSYFGGLLCLAWSQDGKYIATGGEDDLITLFSFLEMRVVLRGRGHSSWINCISFDPWTTLDYYDTHANEEVENKNFETDGEESSNSSTNNNTNEAGHSSSDETFSSKQKKNYEASSNLKITAPKKRTISTLSDIKNNFNNNTYNNSKLSRYYRLASCGQDNQICFWDLTDDVLKEKQPNSNQNINLQPLSNHKNGINLPQIIIEPNNDSIISTTSTNNTTINSTNTNSTMSSNSSNSSNNSSTTRSLVSTAKNLFTNSSKKQINTDDFDETKSTSSGISSGLSTASSFFRRHRRNNTHSSVTSTDTTKSLSKASNKELSSTSSASSKNQITLNSYKKSSNSIFSNVIGISSSKSGSNDNHSSNNNNNNKINDTNDSVNSSKSNGINSLIKKNSFNNHNNKVLTNPYSNLPFNLCPKLDQVPMIEPLICKRISNERLTSLIFRKDCFIVANQDGLISTWARPTSNKQINSIKILDHIVNEQLPQLSTKTDNRQNFTSL